MPSDSSPAWQNYEDWFLEQRRQLDCHTPAMYDPEASEFGYTVHTTRERDAVTPCVESDVDLYQFDPKRSVKVFNHHTMILRTKRIAEATRQLVVEDFPEDAQQRRLDLIDRIAKQCEAAILERCHIHPKRMRGKYDPADSAIHNRQEAYFSERFNRYRSLMKTFIAELAAVSCPVNRRLSQQIRHLDAAERRLAASTGRPNVIHRYHLNGLRCYSIQRPLARLTQAQVTAREDWAAFPHQPIKQHPIDQNYHTDPSTIRHGEGRANSVESSFWLQDDQQWRFGFRLLRGSAPPPFEIKSPTRLSAMTARVIEQRLVDCARLQLSEMSDADRRTYREGNKTLSIDLHLLSALSSSIYEETRPEGNENQQISETANALRLYNQQRLTLMVDGEAIKVKPTLTLLTAGANLLRNIPSLNIHLQREINNDTLPRFVDDATQVLANYARTNPHLQDLVEDAKALQGSPLINDGVDFDGLTTDEYNALRQLYRDKRELLFELEKAECAYAKNDSATNLTSLEALQVQYDQVCAQIRTEERRQEAHQYTLFDQQKASWDEHHAQFLQRVEALEAQVEQLPLSDKRNYWENATVRCALIARLLYEIQFLYYERRFTRRLYKKTDYFFEWHTRYTLCRMLMGHHADVFCKSAKDRTGMINNLLEAQIIHLHTYGRLAKLPTQVDASFRGTEDYRRYRQEIHPVVHRYSASRANSGYNAPGCEGLQLFDSQCHGNLPNVGTYERIPAGTAKRLYHGRRFFQRLGFQAGRSHTRVKKLLSMPECYDEYYHPLDKSDGLKTIRELHAHHQGLDERRQAQALAEAHEAETETASTRELLQQFAEHEGYAMEKKVDAAGHTCDELIDEQDDDHVIVVKQNATTTRSNAYRDFVTMAKWHFRAHDSVCIRETQDADSRRLLIAACLHVGLRVNGLSHQERDAILNAVPRRAA